MKTEILASVQIHKKVNIEGLVKIFPQHRPFSILRTLFLLQAEGWLKIRKHQTLNGSTGYMPNVVRTKKTRYKQPTIFGGIDDVNEFEEIDE